MRKSNVETRGGHPAVNVKVYKGLESARFDEEWDAAFTLEWVEENINDEESHEWFWEATRIGWETLDSAAEEIFGCGVKVYQEGRSGGWAVVHNLPDVEEWDAIMLGRWARFCKIARLEADDVPYRMLDLIYYNRFEFDHPEQVETDSQAAACITD